MCFNFELIPLKYVSGGVIDDAPALVQVMAWYRQETSHDLNQCWPLFIMPYGLTRPLLVKNATAEWCVVQLLIIKMNMKSIILKLESHFPGTDELTLVHYTS